MDQAVPKDLNEETVETVETVKTQTPLELPNSTIAQPDCPIHHNDDRQSEFDRRQTTRQR